MCLETTISWRAFCFQTRVWCNKYIENSTNLAHVIYFSGSAIYATYAQSYHEFAYIITKRTWCTLYWCFHYCVFNISYTAMDIFTKKYIYRDYYRFWKITSIAEHISFCEIKEILILTQLKWNIVESLHHQQLCSLHLTRYINSALFVIQKSVLFVDLKVCSECSVFFLWTYRDSPVIVSAT